MKNSKPILIAAFLLALFSISAISGCKKDDNDNNGEDWATALIGVYTHDVITGGTTYHEITTFTVGRESNNMISIKIDRPGAGSFVTPIHSCFDSIVLSSSSNFSFNETDS